MFKRASRVVKYIKPVVSYQSTFRAVGVMFVCTTIYQSQTRYLFACENPSCGAYKISTKDQKIDQHDFNKRHAKNIKRLADLIIIEIMAKPTITGYEIYSKYSEIVFFDETFYRVFDMAYEMAMDEIQKSEINKEKIKELFYELEKELQIS